MPMSRYNRENPFMYLLEKSNTKLMELTQMILKEMIILSSFFCVSIILNIITIILRNVSFSYFIFSIIFIYMMWSSTVHITRLNKDEEIADMILSDKYRDININNEQFLTKINQVNIAIGRAELLKNMIPLGYLIYILMIGINIIVLL